MGVCVNLTSPTTAHSRRSMTELRNSLEYVPGSLAHNGSTPSPRSPRDPDVPNVLLEGDPMKQADPLEDIASRVAIAIDPVALITTECITVTSAMRKHARWAHSSVAAILGGSSSTSYRAGSSSSSSRGRSRGTAKPLPDGPAGITSGVSTTDEDTLTGRWGLRGKKGKSMQDNPLMSAFARLRGELRGCRGSTAIIWFCNTN